MRQTELLDSLRGCIQRQLVGEVAVLFSGGLDSAVLASLARPSARLGLFTVGYPESHDLKAGKNGAEELGVPWCPIVLDDSMVRNGVAFLRSRLDIIDPVTISFELPMFFVCSSVTQPILLSGQGADELFAGYSRYSSMDEDERARSLAKDQAALMAVGVPREEHLASMFGKSLVCPYLCPEVVEVARRFTAGEMIGPSGNKLPLRVLAAELGLSAANAPKKAAQYGSGIMAAMKRMAAKGGVPLDRWVREAEK
ncbi:MAG: asparagine synthase-related protein [Methanomassiliicoccales archaeon]|nr:asparagine synthase-related protein [Methanomassiliicoccales archaeon]